MPPVEPAFTPAPVDWSLLDDGVPEHPYLKHPYLPGAARVWVFGPAESCKSLYAAHTAAALTREGHRVVFVSQENPLAEELRRFGRLGIVRGLLDLYHDQGIDLADPTHVEALAAATEGAALVVLDTLSACWSGDENSNAEISAFDREALQPLVRVGAAVLVLDHTGHPHAFPSRSGANAGRGASAKAQKADVALVFKSGGDSLFAIHHVKNRFGGRKALPSSFRVVDTDDDGLDLVLESSAEDVAVTEMATRIVKVIEDAGEIATTALRLAVGGNHEHQSRAFDLLRAEDPARVAVEIGYVERDRGRKQAKVWRSTGPRRLDP